MGDHNGQFAVAPNDQEDTEQDSPRPNSCKKAVLGIVLALIAVIVILLVIVLPRMKSPSEDPLIGAWHAYTDYGVEQGVVLAKDGTAAICSQDGSWKENSQKGSYSITLEDGGDIELIKDGDNLRATVTVDDPEADESDSKESEEESLTFYRLESDAKVDYDARLASWKQQLAGYEADLKSSLVGGWQYGSRDDGSYLGAAVVSFGEDGTYRTAQQVSGAVDLWTGGFKYKVENGSGTWKIDDSGITDSHMKFFRDYLKVKVKVGKKLNSGDESFKTVKIKDDGGSPSVAVGKKGEWKKSWNQPGESPSKLLKSVAKSDNPGDKHKKTLLSYFNGSELSPNETRNTEGQFSEYDLDDNGAKDILSYRIDLNDGGGKGATIARVRLSTGDSKYILDDSISAQGCTMGLLTMENGSNFVFVELEGEDDDEAGALLQYRDGALEPVASSEFLGRNIKHLGFESVTTSGNKVAVTFVGQPLSTGIMYLGYDLRFSDGKLSKMGDTTDSLKYFSMRQSAKGGDSKPGTYKMSANKQVVCYQDAGDQSNTAFSVEKGQKVTFEKIRTVDDTLWFQVKRSDDGARGWFANATDYVEPLPFADFIQAG